MDIYGPYRAALQFVMDRMENGIAAYAKAHRKESGELLYEHLSARLKSDASMTEKLSRKGYPVTPRAAVTAVHDAVGIRIVCRFVDDVYENAKNIRRLPGIVVTEEKDYIRNAKPSGYRSYHMILQVKAPFEDGDGNNPGRFFAEVQLRTIAMDSWASLEHEMKYKQTVRNARLIEKELKRCADELASCDISMQTIRRMIRGEGDFE